MSVQSVITQGRAFSETLMGSTGVVQRSNGTTTTDPVTQIETPNFDVIYTGAGKIKFEVPRPHDAPIPGAVAATQAAVLSLPVVGSEAVTTGDIWVCTANPFDVAMVGRRYRVSGLHAQTYATARRFPVEEDS